MNVAAPEDVHRAAERFERQVEKVERVRELHQFVRVGDVELRIGFAAQRADPIARLQSANVGTDRIHDAPAFVAQITRSGWELHPLGALPRNQVGCADAATLEADADLAGSGLGLRHTIDPNLPRAGHNGSPHRWPGHYCAAASAVSIRDPLRWIASSI